MSSSLSPAVIQGIISSLQGGRVAISAETSAVALVIYDYFLTISSEQKHMWKSRKKPLVLALFTILRYATLAYQITSNLAFFLPIKSNKGCAAIIYVEQVCFIFSSAALSGIFAVRTWAIYQRNRFVLGGLVLVSAVKIFISAIDFFVSAKVAAAAGPFAKFAACSQTPAPSGVKWNTASASLALTFDTIVLALTVAKTVRTTIQARRLGMQNDYTYYILRDGLMYYLVIEVLLLLTVIFNQIPSLVIDAARPTIILQTSVAPILAQRLVLNLRSINTGSDVDKEKGTATQRSELVLEFAHGSIIGNIGAPLRTGLGGGDGDDYEDYDREEGGEGVGEDGQLSGEFGRKSESEKVNREGGQVGEVITDVRIHGGKYEESCELDVVELPSEEITGMNRESSASVYAV